MPHSTRVDTRSDWFLMIIGYLKLKSFVLWLQLSPQSTFEQFDDAWPALLDQMLARATAASFDELKKSCQTNSN